MIFVISSFGDASSITFLGNRVKESWYVGESARLNRVTEKGPATTGFMTYDSQKKGIESNHTEEY